MSSEPITFSNINYGTAITPGNGAFTAAMRLVSAFCRAIEPPGTAHSLKTRSFSSALCGRRDQLLSSSMVSTSFAGGHHRRLPTSRIQDAVPSRLQ